MADPLTLSRLLLYGSPDSRRSLAHAVRESGDSEAWEMLAATVRSREPWLLRARCLEVLAIAAAGGDEPTAERILTTLLGGEES